MSVWADIHRRANGVQERKEDKTFKGDKTFNEYETDIWSSNWGGYGPVKKIYDTIKEEWVELPKDYSRYISNPWKYKEYDIRDLEIL